MKGETNQNLEVSFLGERDVERCNNHWTSAGGNPAKYTKRVNINPHVILPWNRYHENSCYRYQTCTIWHFNFVQMWSLPYLTESEMANKQKKKAVKMLMLRLVGCLSFIYSLWAWLPYQGQVWYHYRLIEGVYVGETVDFAKPSRKYFKNAKYGERGSGWKVCNLFTSWRSQQHKYTAFSYFLILIFTYLDGTWNTIWLSHETSLLHLFMVTFIGINTLHQLFLTPSAFFQFVLHHLFHHFILHVQ